MSTGTRAIHQGFLPTCEPSRAYVWKYTPVNWGRRPRHFHIEPEFNLIASGRATFGIGSRIVEAVRGDLIGFPPGQDHVLLDASPDLFLFAIGMDPGFSSDVLRAEDATLGPLHLHLASRDFEALVARAAATVDRSGVEQACAELWENLHWIGRNRVAWINTLHVLTRRSLSVLVHSPWIGLDDLSARFHSSPSEVSRHFHQDMGLPFVQYRARLRLLHLVRLVDTAGMSLMTAAQEAHFGSYSQCHRVFQAE